jgi:PAS domain S-box-containing protein
MNAGRKMEEKPRILIVDDDESTRKSLSLIFKKKGYETHTAGTGKEGLAAAKGTFFNAALLDIRLPDIQGIELIKPLKEIHPDIAIIMATGFASLETAVRALNEGAVGYIAKPLNMDEVLAKVSDVLEKQRLVQENRMLHKELRKSEERYREMFEHMTSGVAVYEAVDDGNDFVFKEFNRAAERIENVGRKDIIGKRVTEAFPGVKAFGVFEVFRRVLRTGGSEFFPEGLYRDERDPGTWRETWVYRLPSGDIVAVYDEITERRRMEEALRESEVNLSMAQRIAGVGSWDWDIKTDRLTWSTETYRIFNRDPGDYTPRVEDALTSVCPDDRKLLEEKVRTAIEKNEPYEHEYRITNPDGTVKHIHALGEVILDQEGRPVRIRGSIQDVTERKRAEEELRESEQKLRLITDNSPAYIAYVGADDLLYRFVNRRYEEAFGMPVQEIVGKHIREVVGESGYQFARKYIEEAKAGNLVSYVNVIDMQRGKRWLEVNYVPDFNENGTLRALVVLSYDITDQKQAEEALRESEEKFRSLFQTSRDFMCITDLEGRFIDTNDAGREFFGYSSEELSTITMLDLYPNPEDRRKIINGIIESGYVTNLETKLKKKSGEIADVVVTVNMKRDSDGNPVNFFASARDMTEKRKMEQQLLQTEKLSTMGTMISGVAHELNNPLTSIIGNAQMLAKRDVPDDIKSKLDVIIKESIRSSKIVGGLLAFAREHRPERRMIDINNTLMESLKLREYDLRASNINVRTLLSEDLPETSADAYQLHQVFINIINNARDALVENGGDALVFRTYRKENDVLIEFEDNGPGIPEDLVKKIFDPFFTTKEVGKGTGLGLSMAYGIIKEHGGTISVESKPGSGAKFTVTLPILDDREVIIEDLKAPVKVPHGVKTVLVVEDEASLRDLLAEALTEGGFFVEAISNGEQAIRLIGKRKFDAVISDIKMPGIGGKELYLYIQKHHPEMADNVIFITGDVLSKDTLSFLQITNNRYIEKPFDVDALVALLNDVLLE